MNFVLAAFNFLAFEAAWFAAVSGGAKGWPWAGALPAVAVVIAHLALHRAAFHRELCLVLAVTALGVLVETSFVAAGLIRYAGMAPGEVLPPAWIWALWFGFGTLPNASLAWLRGRWALQTLLGALAGPLTYWAGVKMGAASLPMESGSALLAIGLAWALALPTIFLIAETVSPPRPARGA